MEAIRERLGEHNRRITQIELDIYGKGQFPGIKAMVGEMLAIAKDRKAQDERHSRRNSLLTAVVAALAAAVMALAAILALAYSTHSISFLREPHISSTTPVEARYNSLGSIPTIYEQTQ